MTTKLLHRDLTYKINGIIFSVQNTLGSFASEGEYCDLIEKILKKENINYKREKILDIAFEGERKGRNRVDFIIDDKIILEIKAKQSLERADYNQLMRYLQMTKLKLGLLINLRPKQANIKRILNPDSNDLAKPENKLSVKIKRLDKTLPLPEYKTPGSVAFDFSAREEIIIPAGKLAKVPTGLIIETPKGYGLIVAARSSIMFKKGLLLSNGIGVIDNDYCGKEDEILISFYNTTSQAVTVNKGERIAQGLFMKLDTAEWQEIEMMSDKSRGGYGSTG